MANGGLGWVLVLFGVGVLAFPGLWFQLSHLDHEDAEISDAGRTLYRLGGIAFTLVGVLLLT